MATCYKVVSQGVFPGHYNSAVIHPHPWEVSYKPGKWIRAPQPDTGLFVFETLKAAIWFKGIDDVIWECECEEPLSTPEYILDFTGEKGARMGKRLQAYWDEDTKNLDLARTPPGTLLFKKIKLTKRLDPANNYRWLLTTTRFLVMILVGGTLAVGGVVYQSVVGKAQQEKVLSLCTQQCQGNGFEGVGHISETQECWCAKLVVKADAVE